MTITAAQVKQARSLLGWTRDRLAGQSGLSPAIISHLEAGKRVATAPRLSPSRDPMPLVFIAGEAPRRIRGRRPSHAHNATRA